MQFAEIPEHHAFKNTLISMARTGKVAHAQLFVGPVGSANLALALAFATYLNCSCRQEADACGRCFSCVNMAQFTHPDVQLVFPKKSSGAVLETPSTYLEAFRNYLKENPFLTLEEWATAMHYDGKQCQISRKDASAISQQLSLKPFIGPYKIVCIWLPEYLHHTAANALLKTLEEPPVDTVFLLVSSNSDRIISTIRSRSQQHTIPPCSEAAIQQLLWSKHKALDADRCKAIACLAEGSLYKAFQLVEQDVEAHFERFSHWMRSCYRGDLIKLVAYSEAFYKLSADAQKAFFAYALQLIRVVLLGKLDYPLLHIQPSDEATFSKKFGLTVTIQQLKEIIEKLMQGYYYLERNAHAKMVYTHLSIQIARIFGAV
ncbi:MAG: DNA polymerase III subunit delta [Candidatus Cardinium sp.]|uniref:DNA polymerase III subunit n=1 Tax=Candidatus Cardinium sp. TP TaxID=2961955 RepID=UPI0021AEBCE1|nr:DNA polymerase III subunit delta' [Candidatus Cardinium sp. TP]MCT4697328.1 DNA polymerase III subunit delta [Candidatus Cardinium sp. TP]MDN5247242.1 DNA polymerase III subunit delta [Candidatus Cardinium sp.]